MHVYMKVFFYFFVIISQINMVSSSSALATELDYKEEYILYLTKDAKTSEKKGLIEIRITKKGAHFNWFEKREQKNGNIQTFDVVFEKETLLPVSYARVTKTKESSEQINLHINGEKIQAEITDSKGNVTKQSIEKPEGTFVIEPFLKKYLALQMGKGIKSGSFQMITLVSGKLLNFNIKWETTGREEIKTPAGTFNCIKVKAGPSNWFVKSVLSSSEVWFDSTGTYKVVYSLGKRSRFDDVGITELEEYKFVP